MSEKKKSSSPWTDKLWTPNRFKVQERKGYRVRFVAKENINDCKNEGYSIADGKNYGEDVGDVIRKGMVMMETPEQNALDRTKYYSNLTDRRSQSSVDMLKAKAAEGNTEAEDTIKEQLKKEPY